LISNWTQKASDYAVDERAGDDADDHCRVFEGSFLLSATALFNFSFSGYGVRCSCPETVDVLDRHCRKLAPCQNNGYRSQSLGMICACSEPYFGELCDKICDQGQILKGPVALHRIATRRNGRAARHIPVFNTERGRKSVVAHQIGLAECDNDILPPLPSYEDATKDAPIRLSPAVEPSVPIRVTVQPMGPSSSSTDPQMWDPLSRPEIPGEDDVVHETPIISRVVSSRRSL
ncbi:hypothetical protein OSTOST_14732, partial [Ostertagia ostertagi]